MDSTPSAQDTFTSIPTSTSRHDRRCTWFKLSPVRRSVSVSLASPLPSLRCLAQGTRQALNEKKGFRIGEQGAEGGRKGRKPGTVAAGAWTLGALSESSSSPIHLLNQWSRAACYPSLSARLTWESRDGCMSALTLHRARGCWKSPWDFYATFIQHEFYWLLILLVAYHVLITKLILAFKFFF